MMLQQHSLSAAFPAMPEAEFRELVEDIRKHGQRDPILVYEGMVLDGWHRYRACAELGVKVKQFTFSDDEDPVAFVESVNLHRRHLSASQRAVAIVALKQWAPAGKRNVAAAATLPTTNAEMAKEAKVSPRTIRDAKVVTKAGLAALVRDGAMTVEEGAKVARGKPEPKPTNAPAKPKRELPAEPVMTNADEAAELRDTVRDLAEENERLNDRLAVESMDATETEKTQAALTIKELRERVRQLEIELDAVKASRDSHMRENAELKRQCAAQRRQLDKLQKAAA